MRNKGEDMGKHLVSRIAIAICLVSLIMGCTIHIIPSKIPPLDIKTEGLAGPFNNITVNLVNAQDDDTEFSVKGENGRDTGYLLSRKFWTEKLKEALGAELMARQTKIVGGAPVTISLKVMDVTHKIPPGVWAHIEFDIRAIVTSNSGWTKTYFGKGDAVAIVPAGMTEDKNWNRSANWAIRDVVLAIMSDPEFIATLGKNPNPAIRKKR
jgi:hypothetical protein